MNILYVLRVLKFASKKASKAKICNQCRDCFTPLGTSGKICLVSVCIKAFDVASAEGFFNGVEGHGAASHHYQFRAFRVQSFHQLTNFTL